MIGLKVYPDFTLQDGASTKDAQLLDRFNSARDCTGAQYINFTVVDYGEKSREMRHFLTYPMSWISHYLKNSYQETDPLLTVDYRRVAYVDWADLWRSKDEFNFFSALLEYGIGDNGVSMVVHLEKGIFGVISFVYEKNAREWAAFRDQNLELMRQQSEFITEQYKRLYTKMPVNRFNLTKRELECLRLVAVGETDSKISTMIGIGRWTVNSHVKSTKFKLGVSNRSAAVAKALTLGLMDLKSEFQT